ncbi:MAG: nucleotidyl transferase AbiEii/AbiGii toxin family protein [Acidobacteriota bacterium]|nr:nucleotidyl transferase AbiEii/AbiGii toxin family protein [Acidobacteriota bacterium]MDH3523324.1 nucleotidyl transferase AbiEii/AbiGii toxin family protein [Acidobacteriota bacterium]
MNRLQTALRDIGRLLEQRRFDWALIGGLAVSVRAEPRFTRDVDLAVAVESDTQAERLVGDLRGAGYEILETVEQEATGRFATARLLPPGGDPGGVVVDLLFASSGIEPEVVASAESLEMLPGFRVPVAGLPELIALKLLARDDDTRPQDAADLAALTPLATAGELESTRKLVRLIEERGYHRGRDLIAELERLTDALGV